MHPSLAQLDKVSPDFLDPGQSLVVITEDAELAASQSKLALEAIAHMLEDAAGIEHAHRKAGHNGQFLQVPYECMAALMRVVAQPLGRVGDHCSVQQLADLRPDLLGRVRS
jgi:hypothetical protein